MTYDEYMAAVKEGERAPVAGELGPIMVDTYFSDHDPMDTVITDERFLCGPDGDGFFSVFTIRGYEGFFVADRACSGRDVVANGICEGWARGPLDTVEIAYAVMRLAVDRGDR